MRHAAFWLAWYLFHAIIYGGCWRGGAESSFYISAVEAAIFMPVHMFLSYSIIYFLFPRFLFKGRYIQTIIGFAILLIVTAMLSHFFSRTFIVYFRQQMGIFFPVNTLLHGMMAGLRGSNTVAGFAAAITLTKHWYFRKTENERLEKEKLRAELELLKGQLHPHFLFNTLNNLYSLVIQKSGDAPEVVLKLSELLRYMLTESSKHKISLEQELSIVKNYMALERIRFGERLDLSVHVNGDFKNKNIAPLLLLPFVENAFKHGANEMLEQPWVSLDIEVRNNLLQFKMINGKMPHGTGTTFSPGIGLQNVRRRLEMLYMGRYDLRTREEDESFVVNLNLDLETA